MMKQEGCRYTAAAISAPGLEYPRETFVRELQGYEQESTVTLSEVVKH